MKSMMTVPAKAVSDLMVWDVAIGVWAKLVSLLSSLLKFLTDFRAFNAPED